MITPVLGALRNYTKRKNFKILLFMRTPIICMLIYFLFSLIGTDVINNVLATLILERWVLLLYKTYVSIVNNDYKNKKTKYMKKYGSSYIQTICEP